ncbi:hypothetical protein CU633_20185 [Bacillus sp. V3-13]|nr:hypothetical protein CU633_20185 [Bacillus sp. V3-13]
MQIKIAFTIILIFYACLTLFEPVIPFPPKASYFTFLFIGFSSIVFSFFLFKHKSYFLMSIYFLLGSIVTIGLYFGSRF